MLSMEGDHERTPLLQDDAYIETQPRISPDGKWMAYFSCCVNHDWNLTSRMLGVQVPEYIAPDQKGMVGPGNGGMSVTPNSMWNGPNHRRPRGMRMGSTGKSYDYMYSVAGTSIPVDKLSVRLDPNRPEKHAFVEPAISIDLSGYETDLASTRNDWRVEWP
jgi:hypothetical protein